MQIARHQPRWYDARNAASANCHGTPYSHPLALMLKALRFFTLLLAALSLTMESAHVLELPQKMQYDLPMYTSVNGTLHK